MYSRSRYSTIQRRRRKRGSFKKIGTLVTLVVFVLLTFACVRFFTLYSHLRGSDQPAMWRPGEGERIQFLLMAQHQGRLQGGYIISVPGDSNQPVYVLALPGSVLLELGDGHTEALANILAANGIESGVAAVKQLFGHALAIHHYFYYDIDQVPHLVGALGGVEVSLLDGFQVRYQDVDYVFVPGKNRLGTENALAFALANSQPGREATAFFSQKALLTAVFNDIFALGNLGNLVSNLRLAGQTFDSDMSVRDLARFRDTLMAITPASARVTTLPGRWATAQGKQYWAVDRDHVQLLVRQINEGIPPYDRETLVIDVFNGNGVSGFAGQTANWLRSLNFTVDRVNNALSQEETTTIYYLPEYQLAALELAMLFATDAQLIEGRYEISTNPIAIILGKDLVGGN